MEFEDYVKERFTTQDGDLKELKKDVKSLMLFMAVEKHKNKRGTMLISGAISLMVSLISGVAMYLLKG